MVISEELIILPKNASQEIVFVYLNKKLTYKEYKRLVFLPFQNYDARCMHTAYQTGKENYKFVVLVL